MPAVNIERNSVLAERPFSDDRRRSTRKPHVAEAWIYSPTAINPQEERQEVLAINVSRHGVGFNLPEAVPTSAFYMMDLEVGAGKVTSEIRIISCRPLKNGLFEVGAEFC